VFVNEDSEMLLLFDTLTLLMIFFCGFSFGTKLFRFSFGSKLLQCIAIITSNF
jgi:hypothetical protein